MIKLETKLSRGSFQKLCSLLCVSNLRCGSGKNLTLPLIQASLNLSDKDFEDSACPIIGRSLIAIKFLNPKKSVVLSHVKRALDQKPLVASAPADFRSPSLSISEVLGISASASNANLAALAEAARKPAARSSWL